MSENAMAFDVARLQILSGSMEFARGGLSETIRDALGNKASSALHSRAGPLLRYIKFYSDIGLPSLPIEERRAYDFIKAMGDSAPPFPRSFMLSVSFATHILGLICGSLVCESRRIDGAVKAHCERRAKVRQRPRLTAQQIRVLELLVKDFSRSVQDRIMSGFCLMLLYGPLRFSEGQRITGMKLEAPHVNGRNGWILEVLC